MSIHNLNLSSLFIILTGRAQRPFQNPGPSGGHPEVDSMLVDLAMLPCLRIEGHMAAVLSFCLEDKIALHSLPRLRFLGAAWKP